MAPVVASAVALLAIAGAVDAKPLLKPGRHANPHVASILSSSKRGLHNLMARYYGSKHGLSKPAPLPEKRDTALPSGWSYFGCVGESWDERLLQGFAFSSSALSPLLCVTQCTKLGYTFAATEYGDECYCGDKFVGSGGGRAEDSTCNMPCEGDSSESCGSAWYLSLYQYNSSELASCSSTVPTATTSTALPVATNGTTTTVVENGTTSIGVVGIATTGSVPATTANATTAASTATASTTPSATTSAPYPVYTDATDASEWYSLGCAADSSDRLLTGSSKTAFTGMTVDLCLSYCEDAGFKYAGAEYGDECYCSNTLPTTVEYLTNGECNVVCDGKDDEACGGGYALELFELVSNAGNDTDCTSTSAMSSNATATATKTGATSIITNATTAAITAATTAVTTEASTTLASGTTQTSASTVPATTQTAPASSESHYVWAHHMVGNTYPYTQSNWASDIAAAQAAGIDGFALNMGSDSWQVDRISDAYSAAASSGFKLFLSLDMTVLACSSSSDASNLVNLVKNFAGQSAQATHEGKVLVSTFAGSDCAISWKNDFVTALSNAGVSIFFVPSIFSNPSTFSSNDWMDGELNWNSGWPMGSADIDTSSDTQYISALGDKEYWAAVSPFFFTHFSPATWNKNWLYRSDDWLYATRWEDLIAMRDQVKSVEILTWNDYGESSYIGPVEGALPAGSDVWTNGFEHTALNSLTSYYATAFKTGSFPSITQDEIIMWARPHPHDATASNDSTGRPTGWNYTEDYLWAIVLATADSTVTLTSGSNTQTFSVSKGLNKLKLSMSAGPISGSISRSGSTVASYNSGSAFQYTTSPVTYNYNYFVGSSSS
ncbi:uncharacterized protein I206_100333 [Kwoniella pini CBS 10737]|uniref:WSC domain-containing protein n=1 Tax=Kwoniella pini CBS 10737 TaxID=1296096 RepID=A0A1B9IDR3_9TREE|nr:uncharacterized protein I206_00992 [Kwoniella pini CBS 10737]OCF53686.1 hypothetical protein I206_00992 [Kwoniella pini CBS 10737]